MQIPTHPRYSIDKNGVVKERSSENIITEFRDQQNYRAVKISTVYERARKQRIDRLLLRTYKPYKENTSYCDMFLSVKYLDLNRENLSLDNLEWDDIQYTPPVFLHNVWFDVYSFESIEIMFNLYWIVRDKNTLKEFSIKVINHGYLIVLLEEFLSIGLHRLVGLTFLSHPKNVDHLVINHKDLNTQNNLPYNLEWTTQSNNRFHSILTGIESDNHSKVSILDTYTGVVVVCPSTWAAARFLGTSQSTVYKRLDKRDSLGSEFRGFLIKYFNDKTPWSDLPVSGKPASLKYQIAVKNMTTGLIEIYNNVQEVQRKERIKLSRLYRILASNNPIPVNGKCMKIFTGNQLIWPEYPSEIVRVFSEIKTHDKPFKITYKDGSVEYVVSLKEWCNQDRVNRGYPSHIGKRIQASGKWRDWIFEKIDLAKYTYYKN